MTKKIDNLESAFELLETNFMNILDYSKGIKNEEIVKKPYFTDDMEFSKKHPSHPLASVNRFKRISAADFIRDYDKDLTENELNKIEKYLFDCCATVRLSLIKKLLKGRNKISKEKAEKLLELENNIQPESLRSKSVKLFVEYYLEKINNSKYDFIEGGMSSYIGEVENGKANGNGKLIYSSNGEIYKEGTFKNGRLIE